MRTYIINLHVRYEKEFQSRLIHYTFIFDSILYLNANSKLIYLCDINIALIRILNILFTLGNIN